MKLELKHLAPYLPYKVNYYYNYLSGSRKYKGYSVLTGVTIYDTDRIIFNNSESSNHCKLILRPLSDLKNEITHNGEKFVPIDLVKNKFQLVGHKIFSYDDFIYSDISLLFKWHFDVFNLIKEGLAIDINSLNK